MTEAAPSVGNKGSTEVSTCDGATTRVLNDVVGRATGCVKGGEGERMAGVAWTDEDEIDEGRAGDTGLDGTGVVEADNRPGELGLCAYCSG